MVVAELVPCQYVSSMVVNQMSKLHMLVITGNEHGSTQLEGRRGEEGRSLLPSNNIFAKFSSLLKKVHPVGYFLIFWLISEPIGLTFQNSLLGSYQGSDNS